MKNDNIITAESGQLKPLYDEHIDGLLFVSRIRQGVKNRTDTERLAAYTRWYWRHHIRFHFLQEEGILLPLLEQSDALAKKLKHDHDEIRELIISIDRDADSFNLGCLANFIERHIRWEETIFFPFLLNEMPPDKINAVNKALSIHPVAKEAEWNDVFWTA